MISTFASSLFILLFIYFGYDIGPVNFLYLLHLVVERQYVLIYRLSYWNERIDVIEGKLFLLLRLGFVVNKGIQCTDYSDYVAKI